VKRLLLLLLCVCFVLGGFGCTKDDANENDQTTSVGEQTEESSSAEVTTAELPVEKETMSAMSFNILVSSVTTERQKAVVDMVKKYMPDTVGFQEANLDWLIVLRRGLKSDYDFVGEARDGKNSGEFGPIFYNKSKFTLLSSGTKWLSDTPDKVSKYSESAYNRIYTYAFLERNSDGEHILAVNTHLDHSSATAREKQAVVLAAFLEQYPDVPLVLTGDFNSTSSTTAYSTIKDAGMTDSAYYAKSATRSATFTSFGTKNRIIDFIFVNRNKISVATYKVCNENINGVTPSDHHPVLIEYTLK